ncbi:MAG: hypothetical protein Q9216_003151, partial [Gyalolechia sp. 2 TL-2023]
MPFFQPNFNLLTLLLTLYTSTSAQSPSVPPCASTAAFESITSTGCQLTDFPCICRDTTFLRTLLPIVQSRCSEEDFQKTVDFTQGLCRDSGVPISVGGSASTPAEGMSAT